jgi:phosphopentomutase
MFYGWEPLRDIVSPGALKFATYFNAYMTESSDTLLTDECEKILTQYKPDFAFLYMVETDEKGGHDNVWMSDEYLRRISIAIDNVKRMIEKFGDEYKIIIMADHGGHDRTHGTDLPEDMIIPFFFYGPEFKAGEIDREMSLLDIAPTIATILGVGLEPEWEGKSLI